MAADGPQSETLFLLLFADGILPRTARKERKGVKNQFSFLYKSRGSHVLRVSQVQSQY